jgi:hypothetical protein
MVIDHITWLVEIEKKFEAKIVSLMAFKTTRCKLSTISQLAQSLQDLEGWLGTLKKTITTTFAHIQSRIYLVKINENLVQIELVFLFYQTFATTCYKAKSYLLCKYKCSFNMLISFK